MTLDAALPPQIGKSSQGNNTSPILTASSGLWSTQFFSSGVHSLCPQKLQEMMSVPKVWVMFSGTQSWRCFWEEGLIARG